MKPTPLPAYSSARIILNSSKNIYVSNTSTSYTALVWSKLHLLPPRPVCQHTDRVMKYVIPGVWPPVYLPCLRSTQPAVIDFRKFEALLGSHGSGIFFGVSILKQPSHVRLLTWIHPMTVLICINAVPVQPPMSRLTLSLDLQSISSSKRSHLEATH